ncbi:MAG: hypothetical protein MUE95_02420 [Cyclobacteriaceae bacterium]|jgi:hypothetical protein|nr:hypothetical protein [Cyclobacteriaceae bacterium]
MKTTLWHRLLAVSGPLMFAFLMSFTPIRLSSIVSDALPAEKRVLLVAQQTDYKKEVIQFLKDYYAGKSVYTEVLEFSKLNTVKESEWNAIVILQTWEDFDPQPEIISLVNKANPKDKVIVLTTSDTGEEKLSGVDAISSASMKMMASYAAEKIVARVDKLLSL